MPPDHPARSQQGRSRSPSSSVLKWVTGAEHVGPESDLARRGRQCTCPTGLPHGWPRPGVQMHLHRDVHHVERSPCGDRRHKRQGEALNVMRVRASPSAEPPDHVVVPTRLTAQPLHCHPVEGMVGRRVIPPPDGRLRLSRMPSRGRSTRPILRNGCGRSGVCLGPV